jgi:Putative addiction module component
MSTAVETLKTVLAELTVEERSELARFLVDSIDLEGSTDVEAAWDSELARRADEIELARRADEIRSGKASGKPAALVFSQLRKKHQ